MSIILLFSICLIALFLLIWFVFCSYSYFSLLGVHLVSVIWWFFLSLYFPISFVRLVCLVNIFLIYLSLRFCVFFIVFNFLIFFLLYVLFMSISLFLLSVSCIFNVAH